MWKINGKTSSEFQLSFEVKHLDFAYFLFSRAAGPVLGCGRKTSSPDFYSWCQGVLNQSWHWCSFWLLRQTSALPPATEGSNIRKRHKFPAAGCAGGSPYSAPLWHRPGSCTKRSISGIIVRLPAISFTPVITRRLPNQTLCSFRGKAHTFAISHTLSGSGNKNSKLSSDLKLLVWQPARRCHQPQYRQFRNLSADGILGYWICMEITVGCCGWDLLVKRVWSAPVFAGLRRSAFPKVECGCLSAHP